MADVLALLDPSTPHSKPEKKKKKRKALQDTDEPLNPGVVYIGHVPHGFYEEQMKSYFSQFGQVKRVKLARNKKTGRCRGYGFIEFYCDEVAKIVAQTMNNYLMFNKLLKCHFVDPSRVHRGMVGGRKRVKELRASIRLKRAQRRHNQPQTTEEHKRRVSRLLTRERKKRKQIEALGLDYQFPGYWESLQGTGAVKSSSHTLFLDSDPE